MDGKETGAALNASLLLDGEDKILEGNRDAEVFLERPLDEVRKIPLYQANPSLYTALKELIVKSKRGRGVENYALAYKIAKRLMRLNISITPYPLEALGTTGTLVTITTFGGRPLPERREPRKEKPPEPRATKELADLPQVLDSLVEPAFILDMEAVFSYINQSMVSLMGHPVDEIIGRPLSFFMLKEEAKKALDHLVEAARSAPWRGELEFSRADGTTSNIAVTIDLLKAGRMGKGRAESLLGMGRDNTAEARIRRERAEELKRVWNLMESVGLAMVCFTPDTRVTLLSHSAGDLLRTTRDRAIGTLLPELFPGDTAAEIASLLEFYLKGEEVKEAEVKMARLKGEKRGEERTLAVEVRPALVMEGRPREYMMIIREATLEISEKKQAELLLEESRTRAWLLELALAHQDPGGYLGECLAMLEEKTGCSAAAAFLVEDREAHLQAGRGLEGEDMDALRVLRLRPGYARKCGQLQGVSVEIHGGVPKKGWGEVQSLIEKADMLLPLFREKRWRTILVLPLLGEEVAGALALADCDTEKLALIDAALMAAIRDTISHVLPVIMAGEVLLDRPPTGLEDLHSSIREATAVVAGEAGLREDLGGELFPEKVPQDEEGRGGGAGIAHHQEGEHDLLEVAQEAKKVKPSRNHLSLWGEDTTERPTPSVKGIDLPSLIWDIKEYYSRRGHSGEIFLEIEDDLPKLHTDKRLLRESLMLLLDNAMRYSPPGSPVILGVERWGDEVLLRIEDQGPGIPPEVVKGVMQAGLEDPDEEDRDPEGRSSGLFITRKYVTALGGNLSIKGKPDEGTTAFIRIRVLPFVGEVL